MHELSIAMSILELAQEESERREGVTVTAIHVKVGALSGAVKEALEGCFEMACDGTPLQGVRLIVEEVPILVFCPRCQSVRPVSSLQLFCCADCGTPSGEVVQGKELEVVALEVEECNPSPA
jgi:hydrogenase nickel incorporation protein HypA/HybF